ncbi:hypothetical protein ME1_00969 [Bartonella vinsonii subsp. arupensis OK-94-513]|uniref:Uncharacterized protein n=2 Tax=Bartonella vinsonii subsp. arupensis TaxID=110578 RepID=J0QXA2_BARVI|nr:hypothetical protein ME1_00969 [Bartonella vinsonii subsp. arupensis OK-94-513]EJF98592.1 hypothetical protein MEI_00415 [Bartonella vinsonii subsp. arupensis Pm136co]
MGENRQKSHKMRQKNLTRCIYKQPIKSKLVKLSIHFMGNQDKFDMCFKRSK